ncbi:unnamed protein product [Trichogramma brassicae]|uniref:Homeobox domain-containing protein n=1 Tax=Trichogramma brassicae TaxID=86971 RepID=A0A6H5IUV6_9HYME|nr:unnamed protein product [Trichogramma brassicae]
MSSKRMIEASTTVTSNECIYTWTIKNYRATIVSRQCRPAAFESYTHGGDACLHTTTNILYITSNRPTKRFRLNAPRDTAREKTNARRLVVHPRLFVRINIERENYLEAISYTRDPASGVADYAIHQQDQAQFEADKRAVYKHPLFPLLGYMFEKCELATLSYDSSPEDVNGELQQFLQQQASVRQACFVHDPEIDGLVIGASYIPYPAWSDTVNLTLDYLCFVFSLGQMIEAILVLRIHLLELEKVQELCKDFCNRYISCLKSKMQSENLLRSDYGHGGGGHDGLAPSSGSNGSSPLQVLSSTGNDVEPGANGFRVSSSSGGGVGGGGGGNSNGAAGVNDHHSESSQSLRYADDYTEQRLSRSSSVSDSHQQHQQQHQTHRRSSLTLADDRSQTQELQASSSPRTVHGGTPLSHIGTHHSGQSANDSYQAGGASPTSFQSEDDEDSCGYGGLVASTATSTAASSGKKGKPKRSVLPKHATNIMRAWLFGHLIHPYPTEDEKRQIANETNLTLLQVNNWFINARRRILQPMIEGAGAQGLSAEALTQQQQQQQRASMSTSKQRTNSNKTRSHFDGQSEDSDSGSDHGSSDGEADYPVCSFLLSSTF